uniref:NADH-ubiquinone oxidoreductase chain 3 n=1 Tax=Fabaeformiscandona kushiroensis TaxID=1564202 RepID=A0A0S3PND7_9CRUS|nr:NADH dehydrogenase subunit 3 [Fabaeformiscandona kushiroensis]
MLTATFLGKKTNLDREKASPFECGFSPFSTSRIPFSLRFFMIAIIFLVFDVEIAILLPLPILPLMISLMSWIIISMIFIITLIIGLLHEWNNGALEWAQ